MTNFVVVCFSKQFVVIKASTRVTSSPPELQPPPIILHKNVFVMYLVRSVCRSRAGELAIASWL